MFFLIIMNEAKKNFKKIKIKNEQKLDVKNEIF